MKLSSSIILKLSGVNDAVDETDFSKSDDSDVYEKEQYKEKRKRFPFYNHPTDQGNVVDILEPPMYGLARHTWDAEFTLPETQTGPRDALPYFDESEEITIKEKEPETRKYPGKDIMRRSPWGDFTEQNLNTNGGKMKTLSVRKRPQDAMGDVWQLESEDERDAGDQLIILSEEAMKGDTNLQSYLVGLFEEDSWEMVKKKLEAEGSTWYVWWMDGVRKFMQEQQDEENLNDKTSLAFHNEALDSNSDLDKKMPPVDIEVVDEKEITELFSSLGAEYINLETDLTVTKMGGMLLPNWKKDSSGIEVVGKSLARRLKVSNLVGIALVKKSLQEQPTYPAPQVSAAPGFSWMWDPTTGEWTQTQKDSTTAVPAP